MASVISSPDIGGRIGLYSLHLILLACLSLTRTLIDLFTPGYTNGLIGAGLACRARLAGFFEVFQPGIAGPNILSAAQKLIIGCVVFNHIAGIHIQHLVGLFQLKPDLPGIQRYMGFAAAVVDHKLSPYHFNRKTIGLNNKLDFVALIELLLYLEVSLTPE